MKRFSLIALSGLYLALAGCAAKKVETAPITEASPTATAPAPAVDAAHAEHVGHDHVHGPKCGHKTAKHAAHVDYIHDGHYHAVHTGHVDDHGLVKGSKDSCAHAANHDHKHGKNCGHEQVKHADHVDYVHDGHYHTAHADHVDEHGLN